MTRWFLILGFVAALSGCNTTGTGTGVSASCAGSVPASCPTVIPSYKTDVAPLLDTYCVSCHQAGGQEADKPLDTYAGASALATGMEGAIASCNMPPQNDAQPTTAEQDTILAWIVCGAPNN